MESFFHPYLVDSLVVLSARSLGGDCISCFVIEVVMTLTSLLKACIKSTASADMIRHHGRARFPVVLILRAADGPA